MIVVDTNVVAYLHLSGDRTEAAKRALRRDPIWHVPVLWRSELRSVLATVIRRDGLALDDALRLAALAESLLDGSEHFVPSGQVLAAAAASGLSAYDCEFVVLARALGVRLVTSDRAVLDAFPETAVDLDAFAGPGT